MFRVTRFVLGILLVRCVPGWWEPSPNECQAREDPAFFEEPLEFAKWRYNKTATEGFQAFDPRWRSLAGWNGWAWTAVDTIVSAVGWLIFRKSWTQVGTGFSFLIRLGALLVVCVITHYIFALCWLVVWLLVGVIVTL